MLNYIVKVYLLFLKLENLKNFNEEVNSNGYKRNY